jgi:hypothetical protein
MFGVQRDRAVAGIDVSHDQVLEHLMGRYLLEAQEVADLTLGLHPSMAARCATARLTKVSGGPCSSETSTSTC